MTHAATLPLPLLPLRAGALLPGTVLTVPVGRPRSVALVRALSRGDTVLVGVQRDRDVLEPAGAEDLHPVATVARVHRVVRTTDEGFRLILEGLHRAHLVSIDITGAFVTATATPAAELLDPEAPVEALAAALRDRLPDLAPFVTGGVEAFATSLAALAPGALADRVAASLPLEPELRVEVLELVDVAERLRRVASLLDQVVATSELNQSLNAEVRRGLGEAQRKAMLRERLRAIQAELGEDGGGGDAAALRTRIEALGPLPDGVAEAVDRELGRLETLSPQQAEHHVVRTWLDLVASLPWNARAEAPLSIDAVEEKLNADHFGLEEPKKRILEHLAVLAMGGSAKATILCLAGPPGVGKTSLGASVAEALQRPFVRIALGGVRDEAELRGHRRTYVGALPGRILHGLKTAGVRNPVVLLDEIDKLGSSWMGSPDAALLEILDPEQNHTFTDHYLEQPFDLSEVLFLTTANDLGAISGPLRDRLEIIEVQGYTPEEKARIARVHLLPEELEALAITEGLLRIDEPALDALVRGWTREAGVRQLKRELRKIVRALALRMARQPDTTPEPLHVTVESLPDLVGRRRFVDEVAERTGMPGVATGLAWTPVGGDILFIETSRMPGKGALQITGQLGDVMQESARAALTYVRSHADLLGVDPAFLEQSDLHIHVPAGAVPKDGPSAGVTMFTALCSLLTGRSVRAGVAMTGEVTLRGKVLPVGGIKSKVLAAHAAGIDTIILPKRNEPDLADLPEAVRSALRFVLASDMSEVLDAALEAETLAPGAARAVNDGPVQAA